MRSNGNGKENGQLLVDGSEEITSSKKEFTSCEQNNVDNITKDFDSVAILDDMSTCACCGKEGNSDVMNICNKCKAVKYCNAACKKKHRSKHKKACEKRVAELRDEQLFKDPPPNEECPICFLPLQRANKTTFETCCGKIICDGCVYAMKKESEGEGNDLCAFCRTPPPSSDEERIKQIKNLMDKGNGEAFYALGSCYNDGDLGLPRDMAKANKLWLNAGELGCADGYYNLGNSYVNGDGVEVDTKKAQHYYELAAMKGDLDARRKLAFIETEAGNHNRAMKHFLLAARAGDETSLHNVKTGFMKGFVTKDEYASTLRVYYERQKEMNSDMRDKAAQAFV